MTIGENTSQSACITMYGSGTRSCFRRDVHGVALGNISTRVEGVSPVPELRRELGRHQVLRGPHHAGTLHFRWLHPSLFCREELNPNSFTRRGALPSRPRHPEPGSTRYVGLVHCLVGIQATKSGTEIFALCSCPMLEVCVSCEVVIGTRQRQAELTATTCDPISDEDIVRHALASSLIVEEREHDTMLLTRITCRNHAAAPGKNSPSLAALQCIPETEVLHAVPQNKGTTPARVRKQAICSSKSLSSRGQVS